MSEACARCRFWDVYDDNSAFYDNIKPGSIGDCRRRAPRISEELLRRSLPGPSMDQFDMLANNLYDATQAGPTTPAIMLPPSAAAASWSASC